MRAPRLAAAAACLVLAGCQAPLGPSSGVPRGALAVRGPVIDVGVAQARTFMEVVEAVEPVAEAECVRRNGPQVDCDFQMVVDDRPGMPPNAFQTLDPRGRPVVGFTVALIAEARNADEVAFVVAHETSHHVLGHLARQDEVAAIGAEIFGRIASSAPDATPASIREAQEVGAAVGARSYSKEWELQADALGAVLALRAGFDPVRGSQFFLRIPDPGDRVLGTHPSNAERIAIVDAAASGRLVP